MSEVTRETLEVDVLFVGAGPANLAAAYRLGHLVEEHNAKSEQEAHDTARPLPPVSRSWPLHGQRTRR